MKTKLFFLIALFLFTTPEFSLQANKSITSAYSDNLTPVKKGKKIQRKKKAKSKKLFKKKNTPKRYFGNVHFINERESSLKSQE